MKSRSRYKSPDVSVVVPVYNTAPYLEKCLKSLLNQTLKDIEIIVVDDGSTDESPKIIDSYARRFKRIVAIHKPNGGVGSAYNAGISKARGRYIGFLDSDDWTDKDMYRILWNKASDTKADVVKSNSHWIVGRRKRKVCIHPQWCGRIIRDKFEIPQFVWGHPCHWTAIYKTTFLKKNHIMMTEGVRENAPDIDFLYKVWFYMRSIYVVPKAFVHYRLDRPDSDRNSGSKMSFYLLNAHRLVHDFFVKNKADAACWDIKTYSEFHHLKFELQQRCLTRRVEFIKGLSQLFWSNLNENRFVPDHFGFKDLFLYHVLACLPFLYILNEKLRFWITRPTRTGYVAKWRLFGLWRVEKVGRFAPPQSKALKIYILGIRVF